MCNYCESISDKNLKDNEIVICGIYRQYPNIEGTPYMYCPICRQKIRKKGVVYV